MKKFILALCLITMSMVATPQRVGIGTTSPNASALLDVSSTNKGVLLPRLDTVQINNIAGPANGLIIFCTTYNKPVYWDSTGWFFFDGSRMNPFTVGEYWGGGIVFYVDVSGRHGLIVATNDLYASNYHWGYEGSSEYPTAIGSGYSNTLINARQIKLYGLGVNSIIDTCNKLVLNGFNDWFLPSKDELFLLFLNRYVLIEYDNLIGTYWSSSREYNPQISQYGIWVQETGGNSSVSQKRVFGFTTGISCRVIRGF